MNEDYVPFELAKKLKENEFDWEVREIYERNILMCRYENYPKPTISQTLKWMRECKNIYVQIEIHGKGYVCGLYGRKYDDSYLIMEFKNIFKSYEEAAIAGIEYALDNLI